MVSITHKYNLGGEEPTLFQFLKNEQPSLKTVSGPDENGNYLFTKTVITEELQEIMDQDTLEITEQIVQVETEEPVSAEEQIILEALIPQHPILLARMDLFRRVNTARELGSAIISEFATENIMLGITQAGKTTEVRRATADIMSALQTGSLYDAMEEIKRVSELDKDPTFLTDARLLTFLNKIEDYLELPKSVTLI